MAALNPYLTFNDNCEEAFEFYKSVFGGEFTYMGRFSDAPADAGMPESEGNKILHVSLPIGDSVLMGSDCASQYGPINAGNNFSISVSLDSKEEADRVFAGLSEGGNVTMPMDNTFWGSYFGMCFDKFGFQWMVSYDAPQQ